MAGGVLAVGIYALLCRLQPGEDLTCLTGMVFGPKVGRVLLWLQAVGLAVGAGYMLRRTDGIVPNLPSGYPWIPMVLCLLALAGAWRGRKASLASGAVLFWLCVVTVGVVAVFSLPQIRGAWLRPEGDVRQILPALAAFLLPVVPLYCRKGGQHRRNPAFLYGVVVLAAVAVVLITSACLSPRLAQQEQLPFFTLAAVCRLLGDAARFDAVFCVTVSAAVYCLLLVMLNYCHCLAGATRRWSMVAFIVLALAMSGLDNPTWEWLGTIYIVLTWALLPLCCALMGYGKKLKKREESC